MIVQKRFIPVKAFLERYRTVKIKGRSGTLDALVHKGTLWGWRLKERERDGHGHGTKKLSSL